MIRDQRRLLLKDLCARLPYGVKCHYDCVVPIDKRELIKTNSVDTLKGIIPMPDDHIGFMVGIDKVDALEGNIKPYLRPMSSMTEDEREEIEVFIFNKWYEEDSCKIDKEGWIEILANYDVSGIDPCFCSDYIDWLNAHHFDYRGLIEKDLALEAPEGIYKTE